MRNKKKEAKFFCECCGSEVPGNSKFCPTCGKFFAAVRCPKCGRTGSNNDFKNGCPTCGYAINPDSLSGKHSSGIFLNNTNNNSNIKYGSTSQIWGTKNKTHKKFHYVESSLPIWIYAISVICLVIVIILFWGCFTR